MSSPNPPGGSNSGGPIVNVVWAFLNTVANGASQFYGALGTYVRVITFGWRELFHLASDAGDALHRLAAWTANYLIGPIYTYINRQIAQLKHQMILLIDVVYSAVFKMYSQAVAVASVMVTRERSQRQAAVAQAEAQARNLVRVLHSTIEAEAASAYRGGYPGRVSAITTLIRVIESNDPVMAALTKRLIGLVLDLASIDNPIARLVIGFVLRRIINGLGIEKPLGNLISDLLNPILADVRPHDLHGVILDISARLAAMEGQWSTFFADGGSQVEQAGQEWQKITSAAGDLAILGFIGEAAANPQGWATALNDTVGATIDATASAVAALIGKA